MINIDDLIGVRYTSNGRSRKEGYDCLGLAIEVSKRFGHEIYDVGTDYKDSSDFNRRELICLQRSKVEAIDKPTYEGDVMLMKDTDGVVSHIGIYLGNGLFVHCNKHGVHVDRVANFRKIIGRVYTWLQ